LYSKKRICIAHFKKSHTFRPTASTKMDEHSQNSINVFRIVFFTWVSIWLPWPYLVTLALFFNPYTHLTMADLFLKLFTTNYCQDQLGYVETISSIDLSTLLYLSQMKGQGNNSFCNFDKKIVSLILTNNSSHSSQVISRI
jgi:hypothetical protein